MPHCLSPSLSATFQFVLTLFSFLFIPFIVSLIAQDLCFLDIFLPQTTISSSFFYSLANRNLAKFSVNVDFNITVHYPENGIKHPPLPPKPTQVTECVSLSPVENLTSEFFPPFIYSYQCGSAIFTSYVPIVMLSTTFRMVQLVVWIAGVYIDRWLVSSRSSKLWVFRLLERFSSGMAYPATTDKLGTSLINSPSFVSTQLQCLLIVIVFGLASPPLAAVVCLFQIMDICAHFHFIRQYLSTSPRCAVKPISGHVVSTDDMGAVEANNPESIPPVANDWSGGLNEGCIGAWHACVPCVWLIMYSSSLWYGILIFDMVGNVNAQHPRKALWTLFVMPSATLSLHVSTILIRMYRSKPQVTQFLSREISLVRLDWIVNPTINLPDTELNDNVNVSVALDTLSHESKHEDL